MAKTQKLQIHPAKRLDQFLISRTLLVAVRFHSIREIRVSRINIHLVKQVLMHEVIIALVIGTGKSLVLVQIHRLHIGKVQIPLLIQRNQPLISSDRCRSRRQSQYAIRLQDHL